MLMSSIEIRTLTSIPDQRDAIAIFDATWPIEGGGTEITPNFMQALVHNRCYLGGAFIQGKMVGAAFGFIGMEGGFHLHSHMAAVLPRHRDLNIGTELKLHQYQWALEKKLPFITWTFDPLVKRNAKLNLLKLGVEITDYFPDFYGEMIDSHNAGDRSDRLMAKWSVTEKGPQPRKSVAEIEPGEISISIPEDIVEIRQQDIEKNLEIRMDVRKKFLASFDEGFRVVGFSDSAGYILGKPTASEGVRE